MSLAVISSSTKDNEKTNLTLKVNDVMAEDDEAHHRFEEVGPVENKRTGKVLT